MAVAKLGLKITRSQSGFAFGIGVNEDTFWTRYIRDLRDDIRALSDFNPGKRVMMLSSNQAGNLLTVISLTEDRPGEILSAWIYLPLNITISGEELADVLQKTGEELATGSPDAGRLQELFGREYPESPVSMMLYKSSGDSLAYRYYGDACRYQLSELLGVSLSQPEYQRFKEIFFIDKDSGIRGDRGSDLSNSALLGSIVLFPPEEAFGFRPFAEGEAFESPRSFAEGSRVRMIWKRTGYKSVERLIDVDPAHPNVEPLGIDEVYKYVTYDSILVKNEQFCNIEDYTLRVNNKILEKGMMLAVKETGIREVPVVVSCEGFNTFDGVMDLSAPVTVTLEKKTYAYTFVLPLEGFDDERIQLISETPIDASPLRGYDADGAPVPNVTNYLKYRPETQVDRRRNLLWGIGGIVAGLLIGWLVGSSLSSGTVDRLRAENSALRAAQTSQGYAVLPDSLAGDEWSDSLAAPQQRMSVLTTEDRKAEAQKAAEAKKAAKLAAKKARQEEKAARKAALKARKEAKRLAKIAAREQAKAQKDSLARAESEAKTAEANAKNAAKARKDSLARAEAAAKAEAERKAAEAKAEAERKEAEAKAEAERKAAVVKASPDLVLYLDHSAKWEKGKMESFGEVPGLWDALNARDFDKILSYADALEESSRFTALCKSIRELKKIPGRHFTQNYCVDPADTEITFTGYQNKIDGKLRDLKGF